MPESPCWRWERHDGNHSIWWGEWEVVVFATVGAPSWSEWAWAVIDRSKGLQGLEVEGREPTRTGAMLVAEAALLERLSAHERAEFLRMSD